MNPEKKSCQNCKQNFIIKPEDFEFYNKIKVPAPTFCPECRAARRMNFRNTRTLYKRKIEGEDKEVIAMYSPDSPVKVYHEDYFWSDKWDAMEYGKDYDFNRSFFEQIKESMLKMPWPHRGALNDINSDYCNQAVNIKNCYLAFNIGNSENIAYGETISETKDSLDIDEVQSSELCYWLYDCKKCHNVFFSSECSECRNVFFSKNLINCHDCFGCVSLKNKEYHIFNHPYSREEYFQKLKTFDLGSYNGTLKFNNDLQKFQLQFPKKFYHGRNNNNVSGDYLKHCKNTKHSFVCQNLEDCSYCQLIFFYKSRDCFDTAIAGGDLLYELVEGLGYNTHFCWNMWGSKPLVPDIYDTQYSMWCQNSSHLFGCVGLRNKQYCILNKQYTKEEYEKLVPRIIDHMNTLPYIDKQGRIYKYGEFFPPELSPFSYNETIAQEYFPLTQEQAESQGYRWKEEANRDLKIDLPSESLPDHIKDVEDSIVGQVIECSHSASHCNEQCTKAFKIIKPELDFYRKMNLPLPRLCPNCRHYQRIKQRNPLKLWERQCECQGQTSQLKNQNQYQNTSKHFHGTNPCPNTFQTSYSPDRPEIIYCDECYKQEVA